MTDEAGKTLLYHRVSESIQQQHLFSREWDEDGDGSLPTLKALAEEYGVSVTTAKKAVDRLAQKGLVSPKPKRGIVVNADRVEELKATLSQMNIGVLCQDIFGMKSNVLQEIVKGISEVAHPLGVNWQIYTTEPHSHSFPDNGMLWTNIEKEEIDGVLLATRMHLKDVYFLSEKNLPIVWINDYLPHEHIYSVMSDKGEEYRLLMSYFESHGISEVGVINFAREEAELSMLLAFAREKNIALRPLFWEGDTMAEETEKSCAVKRMEEFLTQNGGELPEHLLCVGEQVTMGVIQVLFRNGIKVPEDVSILAMVSSEDAKEKFPCEVATLVTPMREMAKQAVRMLKKFSEGEKPEKWRYVMNPLLLPESSPAA